MTNTSKPSENEEPSTRELEQLLEEVESLQQESSDQFGDLLLAEVLEKLGQTGTASAPEEEEEQEQVTEEDELLEGKLRLLKVRHQYRAFTGQTQGSLQSPKTTPEALESSFDASPNTPK
jgi:hypothetical protein